MYWKAILVGLASLSTSVKADIAFGTCPSGYTISTYIQTIVTPVSQIASSPEVAVSATSTLVLPIPYSATTGIATPSPTALGSGETSSSATSVQSATYASASPVSPTLQDAQVSSVAPTASVVSSSILVSPASNPPAPSVSSTLSSSQGSPSPSSSPSAASPLGGIMHGQATSYDGGDVDGTCMFSTAGYTLPAGIYGAALSVDNWDTSAYCGACVSVTGQGGKSVKLMIVNQCPGDCGLNHLDLLPNGFTQLADLKVGRINVDWEFVKCDISSPLYLSTQSGSSKYWFSMQVVNPNVPVKSLEVSTDGGNTWQPTMRSEYNFFQNVSGFGVDYVDVRITSATGETIIVKNANSAGETRTDATSNFS